MKARARGAAAIEQGLNAAAREGRCALITYLTLGYPSPADSLRLIRALAHGGADVIELGVPFSDPVADGPVIQHASQHALQAGMTPRGCLELAAAARTGGIATPLVLMGYYNPILNLGLEHYARLCREAGVDGLIVPDLPPEEGTPLEAACAAEGLALIYLAAPTSSAERQALIASRTRGFLYLVSRLGTTGGGQLPLNGLRTELATLHSLTRTPIAVGFGVSTQEQARAVAALGADGVIVGSAIVERATEGPQMLADYTASLRAALVKTERDTGRE